MFNQRKTDPIRAEHEILRFWEEHRCFEKLREKNAGNQRFRFLDGPITANNPMGIHHAWGRSIKDIVLRYKAMNGYSCHYRNGFDTQGLWVEVEVEKELGFRDKKDIEAYGTDRFTRKCVERITHYSGVITQQSIRLGQWMDWEHSYFTHTDENISAIWHFLKTCHEHSWITKESRPMPWCPRCGTSLSEHEMSGSHRDITHTAVYALAPVENEAFDLLVWTTTPWTLAANTALAVNPGLDYALVKCDGLDRPIVLAKAAIKKLDCDKRVLTLIKGSELSGLAYETFFPELTVQKKLKHLVISWDSVEAGEGSGVVHIAPGCGAEDYELGKQFKLPEICPIDDNGLFSLEYGFLSGSTAASAAPLVFDRLREQNKLFKTHEFQHSYPVCWRCKTEVLFRLVDAWTIKTDEIRPKLLQAARTVKWEPPFIEKRMEDWLQNMGNWNISRKRYYGLPLPFYLCPDCGRLTVIGSKEELRERGGKEVDLLPELHRPWIDEVRIQCPQCGSVISRISEIGDVWLDAGIVPFSTLGYFSDREAWEENFPAEWVIEMQEQVRLWFYAQLFMSVAMTGRAPYERVMTNNWVLAEDGSKFSKTGYMIPFDEAAEKLGSDTIRYLFAGAPASSDMRFGYNLGEEAARKLLGFWNICAFFLTYAEIDKPQIKGGSSQVLMDGWLTERVRGFAGKAAQCYERYSFPDLIKEFEACTEDVSNWYIRTARKRFWKETLDEDKQNAYETLYDAIKTILRIMAPVLPFRTEQMWQDLVLVYGQGEESVHLSDFPHSVKADEALLSRAEQVRSVIAKALKLRNENKLKVRQPLSRLYLIRELEALCLPFTDILKDELNVKEIVFLKDFEDLQTEYLAVNMQVAGKTQKDHGSTIRTLLDQMPPEEMQVCVAAYKSGRTIKIGGYDKELPLTLFRLEKKEREFIAISQDSQTVAIDTEITNDLKREGIYREILRHCQVLRKEAGFALTDTILLELKSDSDEITAAIHQYKVKLMHETLSEIGAIDFPKSEKEIGFPEGSLTIKITDRIRRCLSEEKLIETET